MQERLDALTKLLDDTFVITPAEHVASDIVEKTTESEVISEPVADVPVEATHVSDIAVPASQILAERIKSATDLQHAISLNDSFRFTRELFAGDATRMNEVVRLCGGASSLDEAMSVFMSTVQPDEENEAAADFIELLKKLFQLKNVADMGKHLCSAYASRKFGRYDFSRYPHIEGSGFGAGRRHAYFRNIAEAF